MDGVLIVDKPIGPTSHDVVTQVRRAVGVRRVGHTGTLDPMATGVLPVMIGRVTRLARFLAAGRKVYEATIRLGYATDTYDATGRQLDRDEWDGSRPAREATEITEQEVRHALDQFRGTFAQQPPAFSAKKVGGVRAYRLARRARALGLRGSLGIEGAKGTVRPAPVYVTVYDLSLVELTPGCLVVHLVCSPGFYVRSLAHDLGVTLGCGGHLEALRRLASGEFTLADAVPLAKVIEAEDVSAWIRPAQALLHWLPVATLTEDGAKRAIHGQEVRATDITRREAGQPSESPPTEVEDAAVRLTTPDGQLLGLGRADEGHEGALHPLVVLV